MSSTTGKWVKRLLYLFAGVFFLLLLGLIILLWRLDPIVQNALNKQLPEMLGVEAEVGDFNLRVFRGHLNIEGLVIGQPEGFEDEASLLTFAHFSARVSVRSLLTGNIRVAEVTLRDASLNLQIDEDGLLNVMALKLIAEAPEPEPPSLATQAGPKVSVDRVNLENLQLSFSDRSDPMGEIKVNLTDLSVVLEGIHLDWIEVPGGYVPSVLLDEVTLRDAIIALQRLSATGEPLPDVDPEEFLADLEAEEAPALTGKDPLPASPLRLGALRIENFSFSLRDERLSSDPLVLNLEKMGFSLENLIYDPSSLGEDSDPASFRGSLVFLQPDDLPVSRLGWGGRLAPVRSTIPEVNAFVRLTGFELVTVEPLLVPGASAALGGRALDMAVDLAMHEELLNARVEILGSQGVLTRLSIGGTPAEPQVDDLMGLLFGVLSRPLVMLQGVGGNLLGTGQELLGGVADASVAVVEGATRTLGRFARGITDTGRSLVSGDLAGISDGLQQATIGTVGELGSTVAEGSGSILATVSSATSAAAGSNPREAWLATLEERYTIAVEKAQEWVDNRPLPPVPLRETGQLPGEEVVPPAEED